MYNSDEKKKTMENKELELIYEMIIKGETLNNNTLNKYFSNEEINKLLEDNLLYSVGNEYKLTSSNGLYKYGTKILLTRNQRKAYTCFEKCIELDNQNRNAYLELILLAVKKSDYNKVVELFNIMDKINFEENKYNNNLYLHLLNRLTSIPAEYKERLNNITDNILIPNNDDNETLRKQNNIRYAILHSKCSYAIGLLNDLMAENNYAYDVEMALLKGLLSQVATQEKRLKFNLLTCARRKEYSKIISLLEEVKKRRYLTNQETYVYMLTTTIMNIIETKTIPTSTTYKYENIQIYDAIKGNNFKLALEREKDLIKE